MDNPVPLHTLGYGALFETKDGQVWSKQAPFDPDAHYGVNVLRILPPQGEDGTTSDFLPPSTPVRHLDLRFLLAVAADRLEENEAYQRGFKDGLATRPIQVLEYPGEVDMGAAAIHEMIEKYQNGLQRYLALSGITATPIQLPPGVTDDE